MKSSETRVVVLGASDKPDRYSNRAVRELVVHGYQVIPVHPSAQEIEGLDVAHDLKEISGSVHTVTVYVARNKSMAMAHAIKVLKPERVIFNPGAENETLEKELREAGIWVENACTLVLLATQQF